MIRTTATTAPAPLAILSQLLLSIFPLLRSWGRRSGGGPMGRCSTEWLDLTRVGWLPFGRDLPRTGWDTPALPSRDVRDEPPGGRSAADRGRDGSRLGVISRRGAPADRRAGGRPHRRAIRSPRGAHARWAVD